MWKALPTQNKKKTLKHQIQNKTWLIVVDFLYEKITLTENENSLTKWRQKFKT